MVLGSWDAMKMVNPCTGEPDHYRAKEALGKMEAVELYKSMLLFITIITLRLINIKFSYELHLLYINHFLNKFLGSLGLLLTRAKTPVSHQIK